MEAGPVGQGGVDERLAEVDAAAGGVQHPLDEIAHLCRGERERHALAAPLARDEDPVGRVDPQLLDGRVVEVGLQRPVAGDGGEHLAHARRLVVDEGEPAREGEVVVALHLGPHHLRRAVGVSGGVGLLGPQALADPLDDACGRARAVAGRKGRGCVHEAHPGILPTPRPARRKLSTAPVSVAPNRETPVVRRGCASGTQSRRGAGVSRSPGADAGRAITGRGESGTGDGQRRRGT